MQWTWSLRILSIVCCVCNNLYAINNNNIKVEAILAGTFENKLYFRGDSTDRCGHVMNSLSFSQRLALDFPFAVLDPSKSVRRTSWSVKQYHNGNLHTRSLAASMAELSAIWLLISRTKCIIHGGWYVWGRTNNLKILCCNWAIGRDNSVNSIKIF